MQEILNTVINLKPENSRTNISVDFQLNQDYEAIKIECSYEPKNIEDLALAKKLITETLDRQIPSEYRSEWNDWEKFLPLTNLVTLSLDYEEIYIGCAHRHANKQTHIISEMFSSHGFFRHKAKKGKWSAVINVHSVSSLLVPYKLRIFGLDKDDDLSEHFSLKETDSQSYSVQRQNELENTSKEICFKAFELHTHTLNSDGQFTVEELCRNAVQYKYDGIALTDHNTMSGWQDLTDNLENETLPVIRGIEWTTFFGHMLVLGAKEYVDWRYALPDTIDDYIKKIRELDGVVGIAHPNTIGSPMCTGCHWDFNIKNWENVNYIEVWSKPFPTTYFENKLSFDMWTELLNKGYKIAATSGRDWHRADIERVHIVSTYLGIEGNKITTQTATDAIRNGRTYVTSGPTLNISLTKNGNEYIIGDTVPCGEASISVEINENSRREIWDGFNIKPKTIKLTVNGKNFNTLKYNNTVASFNEELPKGWLRIEVYGDYLDMNNVLLAFSSPIYLC